MLPTSDLLKNRLRESLREKRQSQAFFRALAGPTITWLAIGAVYLSLRIADSNDGAMLAILMALFGAHIALAWWKSNAVC